MASQCHLQLCNHSRGLVVAIVVEKINNHFINWLKIPICVIELITSYGRIMEIKF
jgi:hypothetical protein